MPEPAQAPASTESPLAKAADRIRASAQYLLAAFAAVGAILAAGLQIADIGALTVDDDPVRFWAAFGGIAVAVGGIAVAIKAAAGVSTASYVDLNWLVAHPDSEARTAIDADEGLRQARTVDALRTQVDAAARTASDAYQALVAAGDPGTDTTKQQKATDLRNAYTQAQGTLTHLKKIRTDVLNVASFHRTKEAYEKAQGKVVLGALVAAIGVSAFAWGANPPDRTAIDPGEVVPKTPSQVTVALTEAGAATYRAVLGDDCETGAIKAIAFSVTGTTYEVVTERTDECQSVPLKVTEEFGTVVPRVEPDAKPSAPPGS
jgi:hypothetical protein